MAEGYTKFLALVLKFLYKVLKLLFKPWVGVIFGTSDLPWGGLASEPFCEIYLTIKDLLSSNLSFVSQIVSVNNNYLEIIMSVT